MNDQHPALTRRRLLGAAGAAGATGLALGGSAGALGHAAAQDAPPTALATVGSATVPFHGVHQAGITTPLQAHGHLVAFDLAPGAGRAQAAALLRRWSRSAARLMSGDAGDAVDAGRGSAGGPASGVALDAGPCSLTVTFGFGRTFFARTGLRDRMPDALAPLPRFTADALDEDRSEGDLWLQIAADDSLVAFHALRVLRSGAGEAARPRWLMSGFNRAPGATERPMTQRNLMGQVDGTGNPEPSGPGFDERVFVPRGGEPAWMAGGSYAVVRRIRMLLDDWDETPLAEQEKVIGRRKSDGAPLSGGPDATESDDVDLDARTPSGSPAVPADAHVRVAAPKTNGGATMLRRSYSYHDGLREDGSPDAGLLFVAWQADPLNGFVPVQRKLDSGDALSRFVRHEASGLFAVPGGPSEGEYVGQRLLEG